MPAKPSHINCETFAMRVAVGGFSHETNTYADGVTGLTERVSFTELTGQQILDGSAKAAAPGGDNVGGFIAAAAELGYTLIPTFHCSHGPSGTVGAATFEALRDELLAGLRAAAPFDAVALELHGAGVAQPPYLDLEGSLVTAVRGKLNPPVACNSILWRCSDRVFVIRELVGPDIPIVAPLVPHFNI